MQGERDMINNPEVSASTLISASCNKSNDKNNDFKNESHGAYVPLQLHDDLLVEILKYLPFHYVLYVYNYTQYNKKIYKILLKKITPNYIVDIYDLYYPQNQLQCKETKEKVEKEISIFMNSKHSTLPCTLPLYRFLFFFIKYINNVEIIQYLLVELLASNLYLMLIFFIHIHTEHYINIHTSYSLLSLNKALLLTEMREYYSFYDTMFDLIENNKILRYGDYALRGIKHHIFTCFHRNKQCYIEQCNLIIDKNKNTNKNTNTNTNKKRMYILDLSLPYLSFLSLLDLQVTSKKMHDIVSKYYSKFIKLKKFDEVEIWFWCALFPDISYKYYLDVRKSRIEISIFTRCTTQIMLSQKSKNKNKNKNKSAMMDLRNILRYGDYDYDSDLPAPNNTYKNVMLLILSFRQAVYNKNVYFITRTLHWIMYVGTDRFFILFKNYCKKRIDSETYNSIIDTLLQHSINDLNYDYYSDPKWASYIDRLLSWFGLKKYYNILQYLQYEGVF